jgi:hypothetical protein
MDKNEPPRRTKPSQRLYAEPKVGASDEERVASDRVQYLFIEGIKLDTFGREARL